MSGNLVKALSDLKEKEAMDIVRERLDTGDDPMSILDDARRAMEIVGQRFEEQTYFIPDLIYSGDMMRIISELIKPLLMKEVESDPLGRILIGTVAGDIHDLGKNIVAFLLEVNGFQVLDIGIDVPPQKFVASIQEFKPQVVGLSCLLTTAFDAMKETVQVIEKAGLRDQVKIMIGGGVVDRDLVPFVGADAFEPYASGAVSLSKDWLGINTK